MLFITVYFLVFLCVLFFIVLHFTEYW